MKKTILLIFLFSISLKADPIKDKKVISQAQIILVRHGETDHNAKGLLQGVLQNPLNETGRDQAKKVAEKLASLSFSKIYSSPLLRAEQTAKEIQKKHPADILYLSDLEEFHFGSLEGRPVIEYGQKIEEATRLGLYETKEQKRNFQIASGAESPREVYERSLRALKRICKENPNQLAIVVTHGGVCKCLLNEILNLFTENIGMQNTATIHFLATLDDQQQLHLEILKLDGVTINGK